MNTKRYLVCRARCSDGNTPLHALAGQLHRPPTVQERSCATVLAVELHEHLALASTTSRSMAAAQPAQGASRSVPRPAATASSIYFTDGAESGANGWATFAGTDTAPWHQAYQDTYKAPRDRRGMHIGQIGIAAVRFCFGRDPGPPDEGAQDSPEARNSLTLRWISVIFSVRESGS